MKVVVVGVGVGKGVGHHLIHHGRIALSSNDRVAFDVHYFRRRDV